MEYIVILDPCTKGFGLVESNNGFVEKFSSYEKAKEDAEIWMEAGDCQEYAIYQLVTK